MSEAPDDMGSPVSPPISIEGACDPRFAAVREAFATNFADASDPEWGGAVCVRLDGRVVVDIWGGHTDEQAERPWQRDTLVNVYSVGKGILAILVLSCAEEGLLDLDATVSSIWPEFGAHGKDRLRVRSLLGHRAGLPAVRTPLPQEAMYDWHRMCGELAAQRPWWEPDTDHGYHVNTQGFLVGELLRRATGVPIGELVRRRLCAPTGADFHWSLPAPEHGRVSPVFLRQGALLTPEQQAMAFPPTGDDERDAMVRATYFNPPGFSGFGSVNTTAWREAVIPSTNGHGNARSLATLFDAHLCGGGGGFVIAGPALRAEAIVPVSEGLDRVLGRPSCFGLGFQLPSESKPMGPGPHAYGHYGYGGSLALIDPDANLTFAHVTNRPGDRWKTPRTQRLLAAVYESL